MRHPERANASPAQVSLFHFSAGSFEMCLSYEQQKLQELSCMSVALHLLILGHRKPILCLTATIKKTFVWKKTNKHIFIQGQVELGSYNLFREAVFYAGENNH